MDQPIVNALNRLRASLQRVFARGRVKAGSDAGNVQLLQVQLNDREILDNLPRIAEYGYTSMPLPGCQALVVFVGGDRSNGAIVGTSDEKHRMANLQPGEVAIYDDQGQSVHITRTGIVINCGGNDLNINNATHIYHGGINIGNTHTHPDPQGGNTGTPA